MSNSVKTWVRQPIIVVLGHVDHGKTTLLDKIRGTAVAKKEPGEITQHIGASIVPASVLEEISEPLKRFFPRLKIEIPGLLFIDTPGHELFASLRRRGGSVADIAILVVDVLEGIMPQTIEALMLLKERKVPFIVAANKIDRISGWISTPDSPFLESIRRQSPRTINELENKIYMIIGRLYEFGYQAERFDRVRDFRTTVPIVPISAKTGEGLPELLALIAGLAQQFMRKKLITSIEPAKGVVLEVKEEPGLGVTMDTIIYDGVIRRNDMFIVASKNGHIVTHVRGLLLPRPLQDMRMHEGRFISVDEVYAAAGVKIVAPGLEEAIAGSPLYVVPRVEDLETYSKIMREEVSQVVFRSESDGVIVKADTLGSLEALVTALRRENIPIKLADVGNVSKNDVIEASVVKKSKPEYGVIIAFNVKILDEARELAEKEQVQVFSESVIYRLLENFLKWVRDYRLIERRRILEGLVRPAKIKILPGCVFRRSDPAIVGVEVVEGTIKPGYPLMRSDGVSIGNIMQIRDRDNVLKEAKRGQQVAISIKGKILVGRHVDEGDVLYTDIPREHVIRWLTSFSGELTEDEKEALREIISIKRSSDPLYGMVFQYSQ
ncbi:MAG: translation initiation factor IF-2 [Desulfurococcaceae archaeon]|nr:translation initiation factor IF-2 [Desulfurococcaceae archaeon]